MERKDDPNRSLREELKTLRERVSALKKAEAETRKAEVALEARALYWTTVSEIGQSALSGKNLPTLMDEAAARVARCLDVPFASVLELLPDGSAFIVRAGVGWRKGVVGRATVPARGGSMAGHTLLSPGPLVVEDLAGDSRFHLSPVLHEHRVVSGLCVRLRGRDRPYGVLSVHTSSRRIFAKVDADFMEAVANVLSAAIERKRAEEAIRESEERYRLLFESNPHPMWVSDVETLRFLAVNEAAVRSYGYAREEFLGMTIKDIRPPEDIPALLEAVARVQKGLYFPGLWRHRKKDGTIIDVEVTTHTLLFAGRPATLTLASDVTAQRRTEEEMVKASKLESVGVLAGGIAHDFNNILTAVLGNILLTKTSLRPEDPSCRRLAEAEIACLRAKDLTKQLLTFSTGGEPVRRATSIVDLAHDASAFALRGSKVKCEYDLPRDLWQVDVDDGQIRQAINNLVINAQQAMPGGGTIRIRGENVTLSMETPGDGARLPPGRYVRLSIEDEGGGIPKENLHRIFDPYFTTKAKGSGLGLSIAYSIVTKHEGRIGVESRVGAGSVFHILLPASARSEAAHADAGGGAASPPSRGRILVMDDEDAIKDVTGGMLRLFGFDPDFAGDGAEAIALYTRARASGRPYAAVILDLTIPGGMGGEETMRRLRAIDPKIRAIVSSGYSTDPIMADYRNHGFRGVVAKPFGLEELRHALESIFGRPRGLIHREVVRGCGDAGAVVESRGLFTGPSSTSIWLEVQMAAKKGRKPSAAFMKPMSPDAMLAEVVGSKPLPRTQVTKKLWDYIKKHKLQDTKNRRMINADESLKKVFGGKKQVSMFEMTKLVSKHLK